MRLVAADFWHTELKWRASDSTIKLISIEFSQIWDFMGLAYWSLKVTSKGAF